MLGNEKYSGDLRLQKKYRTDHLSKKTVVNKGEKTMYEVKDAHDPIIDRETFEAVKMEFQKRKEKFAPKKQCEHHAFSGLIRCGLCGKIYYRTISAPNTKYAKPNWCCGFSKRYGKDACGATWKIPEDILIEKACMVLGSDRFDESLLRERVKEIVVPLKNEMIFYFKDGSNTNVEWHHRSQRESWTEEMKETARQREINRCRDKKKEKEDHYGS